jgi:hypothetical protein
MWVIASATAAVLATNAAWFARWLLRGQAAVGGRSGALEPLGWLIVSLFYALPPVLAWRSGALSPYLMGLGEVDWARSLTSGLFLALLAVGVLFTAWIVGARRPRPAEVAPTPERDATSTWLAPVDAALLQWHWAFYRAGAAGWLLMRSESPPFGNAALANDPFYWGCWLGMGLVALESALNPFGRAALGDPARRPYVLLRIALAVASTAVFAVTRNLWLALLVHVCIETAAAVWPPLIKALPIDADLSER